MLSTTYSRSAEISKIPHLSYKLEPQSSSFDITSSTFDLSNEYIQSLIVFPAILCAAGILSLLVFSIVLLTRCCFICSKSQPDEQNIVKKYHGDRQQWAKRLSSAKTYLLVTFSFFLIVSFFANHIQFLVRNLMCLVGDYSI